MSKLKVKCYCEACNKEDFNSMYLMKNGEPMPYCTIHDQSFILAEEKKEKINIKSIEDMVKDISLESLEATINILTSIKDNKIKIKKEESNKVYETDNAIMYKNNKTGDVYIQIGKCINTTNKNDSEHMIIYKLFIDFANNKIHPLDDENIYVKEASEFLEKFTII